MNMLVLLIGSNNIPNYVAAKYLLESGRDDNAELPVPERLVLVFSHETEKFKESLLDCLEISREKVVEVPLGSDEHHHENIKKLIQSNLEQQRKDHISSIHLNYTGGTKTMVLAAYDAVASFSSEIKEFYSYLDPENFKLVTTKGDSFPCEKDLRFCVNPTVKNIFRLHCIDMSNHEPNEKVTPEYERLLADGAKFPKLASYEFQCELYEFEKKYDIKKQKDIKETNKEDFIALIKNYEIIEKSECLDLSECKNIYSMVAYSWIEQAVFDVLQKIKKNNAQFGLGEILWSVEGEIRKPDGSRKFEIDVMALRGYQMYVFSCTSDDNVKMCKQKALETNYRAVQMGGEHAKSILVCLGDNSIEAACLDDIQKDMAQFDAARNFSVIGRDCLSSNEKLEKAIRGILQK